jgi:hypothetical protein
MAEVVQVRLAAEELVMDHLVSYSKPVSSRLEVEEQTLVKDGGEQELLEI